MEEDHFFTLAVRDVSTNFGLTLFFGFFRQVSQKIFSFENFI